MDLEIGILLIAVAVAAASFAVSLFLLRKQRKNRELIEFIEKQFEDLENTLARNREAFDTNAARMAEQARRINWLDSRIRQPKPISDEIVGDTLASETPKLNITERRHRVIKLSSRGQNVESIAAALGMLPGEVELIVSLNKAAAGIK